jgi:hypothetical protein
MSCAVLGAVRFLYPTRWSWSAHLFAGRPVLLLPLAYIAVPVWFRSVPIAVKIHPAVITHFLSRLRKLNWSGVLDSERNWKTLRVWTPVTCYKVTEHEIFSIPFSVPKGFEIS